jgi:hypothetical protein
MKYRLLVDFEVIGFIETLPHKEQRLLRNRLVTIQDYPSRLADGSRG